MAGVIERAGVLEHIYGKEHLILKEAAHGTFFSLFGCAIIVVTLVRGLKTPKIEVKQTPEGVLFSSAVVVVQHHLFPESTPTRPASLSPFTASSASSVRPLLCCSWI
jgi:hypothetical protein